MYSVTLYRIDPARNMRRFYRLDVQPDLFGQHCLMREWGRIGRGGQIRAVPYPTLAKAQAALEKQRAVKERRGYVLSAARSGALSRDASYWYNVTGTPVPLCKTHNKSSGSLLPVGRVGGIF